MSSKRIVDSASPGPVPPSARSNIFEASAFVRWTLKLFGIACFTIPPVTNGHASFVTRPIDILLVSANLILRAGLFTISSIRSMQHTEPYQRRILNIGLDVLHRYNYQIQIAATLIGFCWHRGRIAGIAIALHRFDTQLRRQCGTEVPHHGRLATSLCVGLVLYHVATGVAAAVVSLVFCERKEHPVLHVLGMGVEVAYTNTSNTVLMLIYAVVMLAIKHRLQVLNDAIGAIVRRRRQRARRDLIMVVEMPEQQRDEEIIDRHHSAGGNAIRSIRQLRILHTQLCTISAECNACLAWPVAAMTAGIFGFLLFHLLSIYKVKLVHIPFARNFLRL